MTNSVPQRIQVTLLVKSWVNNLREISFASDFLGLGLHFGLLVLHRLVLLGSVFWEFVQAAAWGAQDLRLSEVGIVGVATTLTWVVHRLLQVLLLVVVVGDLGVVVEASSHLIAGILNSLVVGVLHKLGSISAAVREVVVLGGRRSLVACEVQNIVLHFLASQILVLLNREGTANVLVGLGLGATVTACAVLTQPRVVVRSLDYCAGVLVASSSWGRMLARGSLRAASWAD